MLLAQFINQLTRSMASQKQESFTSIGCIQENQAKLGNFCAYNNHKQHSHYLLGKHSEENSEIISSKYSTDRFRIINRDQLSHLQLIHKQQISIFHVFDWSIKDDSTYIKLIKNNWINVSKSLRGLIILYLQYQINLEILQRLLQAGVDIIIVKTFEQVNRLLTFLSKMEFQLFCSHPDVFNASKPKYKHVKIVFTPIAPKDILKNFEEEIQELKMRILNQFYFEFQQRQFQKKIQQQLQLWEANRSHLLIILKVQKLQNLQNKTLLDLIHLASHRFHIIIFILIDSKFPPNLQNIIPVQRHKVIFLNTLGDIYMHTGQLLDLYYHLEINRSSFRTNQNIILQQLGLEITQYLFHEGILTITLPNGILGDLLRKRALKIVKDVNKRSIAKLIVQLTGNSIHFIPFCIHPSFLYKTILSTFSLRIKRQQKGLVINIDATDQCLSKYLEQPEYLDKPFKYLQFHLNESFSVNSSYACNPLSELQLQRMIEILSQIYSQGPNPLKNASIYFRQ